MLAQSGREPRRMLGYACDVVGFFNPPQQIFVASS
jgi:hypothetical protein